MSRIILDLCGGTGAWSQPYRDAGYTVHLITKPPFDVRNYDMRAETRPIHGILAAPPCTEFAVSGARWWKDKDPALLEDALTIVQACIRIIRQADPEWWCLENPVGRLKNYIGPWRHTFNPCDYGDGFTKRTCLWGEFTMPPKQKHVCNHPITAGWRLGPSPDRARLRSITPPGFAKAFMEANP